MLTAYTEATRQALTNLRSAAHFQWYLVPLLAFVVYVYMREVERKNYNLVVASLAFLGGEFAWEMFNALVLHWSGRSAMWTTPGDSAYVILVGLNVEIAMMFSVAGIIMAKALPADPRQKVLGVPNRVFYSLVFATGCVFVEVLLNQWGALVWEYPWWRWPNIWLIIVAYFLGFYLFTWFYDLEVSLRTKALLAAGVYVVDLAAFLVFAVALGWI